MLAHAVTPTPYTIESIAPGSSTHAPPRYWQQTPERCPSWFSLSAEHARPQLDRTPKSHALYVSSQRTLLCCAQYSLTIEKGKNVLLVRVLFRSRALTRIVYLHLYAWHSRVDTKTECSIACLDGTCQGSGQANFSQAAQAPEGSGSDRRHLALAVFERGLDLFPQCGVPGTLTLYPAFA